MRETSVLISTHAESLTERVLYENVARSRACMTAKAIMDVYLDSSFYSTIANFGKVDVHLSKHQKAGEVADAPVEVVHIKDKCSSYQSGAHPSKSDS